MTPLAPASGREHEARKKIDAARSRWPEPVLGEPRPAPSGTLTRRLQVVDRGAAVVGVDQARHPHLGALAQGFRILGIPDPCRPTTDRGEGVLW